MIKKLRVFVIFCFFLYILSLYAEVWAAALNLNNIQARVGDKITFILSIQDAPNIVNVFGIDILFDSNVLEYQGYSRGQSVTGFELFDVSKPSPGTLKVAGVEVNPSEGIASGNDAELVELNFLVLQCADNSTLNMKNMKDNIALWSTSAGSFSCLVPDDQTCLIEMRTLSGEVVTMLPMGLSRLFWSTSCQPFSSYNLLPNFSEKNQRINILVSENKKGKTLSSYWFFGYMAGEEFLVFEDMEYWVYRSL